jgi:glycosyltransferase involved in cell wall biosynthesis
MSKVSVVIPTYNRAHLLCEAIESVLAQSYTGFELIVVDDGSTDNTEEVVRSIADPRVKYVKQANGGPSVARNTGVRTATGEFVAFLDSDDLWLPGKMAAQMAIVEDDPTVGLVYGLYYHTKNGGERKLQGECYPVGSRPLPEGPNIHLSTSMIQRSWIERIGGFDEKLSWSDDLELMWRLSMAGCKMVCVSEPLMIKRKLESGLTREAHRHAADIIAYIDTIFGDPRMPAELLHLRNPLCVQKYFFTAASAYLAAEPKVGRDMLEYAVAIEPTWAYENMDFLINRFVNFIIGHGLDDPEETLRLVIQHLPAGEFFSGGFVRCLWHAFYVETAFEAHRSGQPDKCKKYALRALINNPPSTLRNRGLLSILVRSLYAGVGG